MSAKTIYDKLYKAINNHYGVAGLMGNLYAESGLLSNNLQNTFNKKLGMTDVEYTSAVDSGKYTNFVHDSAGYGLAQWTYYSRKQNLLNFAKKKNTSIGDESMQVDFLISEIKGYTAVWKTLISATSVKQASDIVLTKFEQPANQSDLVKTKRASYGQKYYDSYASTTEIKKEVTSKMTTEKELRQKPVNYLKKYLGIKEGSAEHKAILKVFNDSKLCTRYTMTVKDAWCATAVSSAFISSGLSSIFPCVECSCNNMISKAQKAGIWVENDAYIPSIGDVILYDWQDTTGSASDNKGSADHVGIVESVSGNTMKIIEGNYSDSVKERTLSVNGKYIRGFITPKYSSISTGTSSTTTPATNGTKTTSTKKVSCSGYAESLDKNIAGTYKTTANLNCRDGAGTSKKVLVTIPKNTIVKCYGYYSTVASVKWYLVQFTLNGIVYSGFCSSKYLKK